MKLIKFALALIFAASLSAPSMAIDINQNPSTLNGSFNQLRSNGGMSLSGTYPQFNFGTSGPTSNTLDSADLGMWGFGLDQANTPLLRDFFALYKGSTFAISDGVLNSTTTLTSATANFNLSAIGTSVAGANIPAATTISGVTNSTTATMSNAATGSGSGVRVTFTSVPTGNGDIVYWHHNGFGYPYLDMSGAQMALGDIINGGWKVSSNDNNITADCGTATDMVVDAVNPLKVTSATGITHGPNDAGGWIDVTAGTGAFLGRYHIISGGTQFLVLDHSPAPVGTTAITFYVNMGQIKLSGNNVNQINACGRQYKGGAYTFGWTQLNSPQYHVQSTDPVAQFNGYGPITGANANNGNIRLGGATNGFAAFGYDYATANSVYIDNSANTTSHILLRLKTLGTPITAVDFDNTGTSTFGGTVVPKAYTVSTLPATSPGAVAGSRATVTDATACTFLGALTGGGAVFCPVVYNGTAWVGG